MREDMAKILVERPRRGGLSRETEKKVRLTPDTELTVDHQSMRKRWKERKELNEYLSPLKRYIKSQVGRPWNKVYSEICQRIDRSSAIQLHILQHLFTYVNLNVVKQSRMVLDQITGMDVWRYYVDPDSGLLCETEPRVSWKKIRRSYPIRWKNNDPRSMTQYHQVKDVWYEVGIMPVSGDVSTVPCYDHLHKCMVHSQEQYRKIYGGPYYAASKRQLNSKEIRRLGHLLGGQRK